MSNEKLDCFANFSDEQFLDLAKNLIQNQTQSLPLTKAFLELPPETVAVSIKQAVLSCRPPKPKS